MLQRPEKNSTLIVIDTNIIVNALVSKNLFSKSALLLDDVFAGKYTVAVSEVIINEYRDVLHRPKLNIDPQIADEVIDLILSHSYTIDPKATNQHQIEMKDEKDRPFFDVAKCLNAKLITRNIKDYPVHELITTIDELY